MIPEDLFRALAAVGVDYLSVRRRRDRYRAELWTAEAGFDYGEGDGATLAEAIENAIEDVKRGELSAAARR